MTPVARVVRSTDDAAVHAVLFPVRDAPSRTYLVRLCQSSAQRAGLGHRAGQTLGGIAEVGRGSWAVVAYADRAHLLDGNGPVTFFDDVTDLPTAVAALIRNWRLTDRS